MTNILQDMGCLMDTFMRETGTLTHGRLAARQQDSCTKTYVHRCLCNQLHPSDRLCSLEDETWVVCSTRAAAAHVPSQSPSVRDLFRRDVNDERGEMNRDYGIPEHMASLRNTISDSVERTTRQSHTIYQS